ncbi:MAG: hypothetical protein JWN03_4982 [Nocardia sp.]|uniref:hypothetical protein n=1 Tax=Nocardia sp. TaxID=1821 RepID=UPI0026371C35|nr:hypothetical protein [Nocardia sp.]MCU1644707.1 hypothetical protein [Nocardia sp.]
MTSININANGSSNVAVAENQSIENYYFGDEVVEIRRVPTADFRPCEPGRFASPTGAWDTAVDRFRQDGQLIIVGEEGTGRRVAALRLLANRVPIEEIYELEPVWKQPKSALIRGAQEGSGYLLDLSAQTEEPFGSQLGKSLLDWARKANVSLVVITTPQAQAQRWTSEIRHRTVELGSPAARRLAELRLSALGASERTFLLTQEERLVHILAGAPKASDVSRLAQIIADAKQVNSSGELDIARIVDEYEDWHSFIDTLMEDHTGRIAPRALLWASAFCDGGTPKSVLNMAEALHCRVSVTPRSSLDVLSEAPASVRLSEVGIAVTEGRAHVQPDRHEFAAAVRRHLWDQYEHQIDVLTEWIVGQVAALPPADAVRVVDAAIDLAMRHRDSALLQGLRDALIGERRSLAAPVFSRAAVDPVYGGYVRQRLYAWLSRPSTEVSALIVEVCGGSLGEQMPDRALTRLRRATPHRPITDPILDEAYRSLSRAHPTRVLHAIKSWFHTSPQISVRAFLALAATADGAVLLCAGTSEAFGSSRGGDDLAEQFTAALYDESLHDIVYPILESWREFAEDGVIDPALVNEVFAASLAPGISRNGMRRLLPNAGLDTDSYWGRIFMSAVKIAEMQAQHISAN